MYELGKGVPRNLERAMECYQKAAGRNDFNARGLLKDKPLAEQGDVAALYRLGQKWLGGHGVIEDVAEALRLLEKAADQRYVAASRLLGYMHQNGWKLPQDFVLAHKWYNIAASLGDPKSGPERDAVARLMTAGQVAEAQKLAREWLASQRRP